MKPIDNFSEIFENEMNLTSLIRGLVSFISSLSAYFINKMLFFAGNPQKSFINNSPKPYICNVLGDLIFTYPGFSDKGAQFIYAVNAPSPFITRTQTASLKNNLKHTI